MSVVVSGSGMCSNPSMEGGWSGTPDTTVKPSGGVVGLIQRNTDEGRCLLENPSENAHEGSFICIYLLLYPAAQVLRLDSHVVVFSTCTVKEGLYGTWYNT